MITVIVGNYEYTVKKVEDVKKKQSIARAILEALPDWFGVAESRYM